MGRKKVEFVKELYVADFETTGKAQYLIEGLTRVYLWYIENIYEDSDNGIGTTIDQFHEWITYDSGDPTKRTIFFHNLGFDIFFYEYYLLSHGWTCDFTNKESGFYSVIRDETGLVYGLNMYVGKTLKIQFIDSFKLLQSSVARLPNARGLEKLKDYDYKRIRTETKIEDFSEYDLKYVKHDVWIVKDVLRALLDQIGDFMTIASSSYHDWFERFNKEDQYNYNKYFPVVLKEDQIVIRKAYNGGIVMLNPKYKGVLLKRPVVSFDVNSLYPYVMRMCKMPYGKPLKIHNYENLKFMKARKYDLFVYCVIVRKMTIKKGFHPFISMTKHYTYGKKSDYLNTIKETTFYWTSVDLEDVIKYYDITFEIDYTLSFGFRSKQEFFFNEYIDTYMTMKENAKNEFERLFAKYRLNTLYGKYGTKKLRTSLLSVMNDQGMITFDRETNESKKEFYLPLAVFITAHARSKTVNAIQSQKDGFIYADTDSIHLFEDQFVPNIEIDSSRLGSWKCEGTSRQTLFINNKQYLKEKLNKKGEWEISRTIASLNKESHHLVGFDAKIGTVILNGKKMKEHVKGGYIITEHDFTFT